MLAYLLKRLLIFIPTLFFISIIVFFISIQAPGDPAILMLSQQIASGDKYEGASRQAVIQKRNELGLDQPIFYIDFGSMASYRTQEKIPFQREREMVKNLSLKIGRPDLVEQYYMQLISANENSNVHSLLGETDFRRIEKLLAKADYNPANKAIDHAFQQLKNNTSTYHNYVPKITWNGANNQYHQWFMRLLSGNLGTSYSDGLAVTHKLGSALKTTFSMTIAALVLSVGASIFLAVLTTYFEHTFLPKFLNFLFFSLYSIPTFIVATFAVIFLGSSQYLGLFPVFGMGEYHSSMNLAEKLSEAFSHLFLPISCLAYLSTAFLYQQLKGNLSDAMNKEYTVVAKAKGLSRTKVIINHALRNSLLPLISYLATIFPAIIGGSFVVEFIFSLPGMGMLTMDAVFARDYPVVFASLLAVSLAALIGALLSDLLLMFADPRVSLQKS